MTDTDTLIRMSRTITAFEGPPTQFGGATPYELNCLLGPYWMLATPSPRKRARFARHFGCAKKQVRFISAQEFHAAHLVAVKLRERLHGAPELI